MCDTVAIKKRMLEKKFNTIGSLSKASKIPRNTLGKVLNDKVPPSSNVMYKLVDTLEIPPEEAGRIFFAGYLRNT